MGEPLVSVLMPCWNASGTLPLALASLLAQTYANWECVLIDDGSTDDPGAVVEEASDRRIRYFRLPENVGRAAARQKAMDLAGGDLVSMLDADDWLYPMKLHRQVDAMVAEPRIALLGTGMSIVDKNNDFVGVRGNHPGTGELKVQMPARGLPAASMPAAPLMLRRKQAQQIRFDPTLNYAEDSDYLLRFLLAYRCFALMTDITYVYTEHTTTTLPKILGTLACGRRVYMKHRWRFPVASRVGSAACLAKAVVYRAAFASGYGERLVARRSEAPDERQTQAFLDARRAVHAVLERRFPSMTSRSAN